MRTWQKPMHYLENQKPNVIYSTENSRTTKNSQNWKTNDWTSAPFNQLSPCRHPFVSPPEMRPVSRMVHAVILHLHFLLILVITSHLCFCFSFSTLDFLTTLSIFLHHHASLYHFLHIITIICFTSSPPFYLSANFRAASVQLLRLGVEPSRFDPQKRTASRKWRLVLN